MGSETVQLHSELNHARPSRNLGAYAIPCKKVTTKTSNNENQKSEQILTFQLI